MGWLNMELDDELHARAKSAAALTGRKLYQLVEDAVRVEVERFEAARPKPTGRTRGERG